LTSWKFISDCLKEGVEGSERKKGISKGRKEDGRRVSRIVFMSLKIDITKSTV
jgi:hypothetical protein